MEAAQLIAAALGQERTAMLDVAGALAHACGEVLFALSNKALAEMKREKLERAARRKHRPCITCAAIPDAAPDIEAQIQAALTSAISQAEAAFADALAMINGGA